MVHMHLLQIWPKKDMKFIFGGEMEKLLSQL